MGHVNELTSILQLFFLWNKARSACLAQMIIAMFSSRTVNLSILADQFVGCSKKESNYKRIIRFLSWMPITISVKCRLGSIVLYLLKLKGVGVYVSMDRTCWEYGKRRINFLVVGIDYHGISVPIFFKLLPKCTKNGNSNTTHRIKILKYVVSLIGAENIICFSADREFVGKDWFIFLKKNGIKFVIRVKENTQLERPGTSHKTSAKELCKRIKCNKKKRFKGLFNIWGIELYVAAARNDTGELMVLVSNVDDIRVFKKYLKRWSIETLFKYLKTHGFNLEDTRIIKSIRLEGLFFILTLAVAWTLVVSQSLRKTAPLRVASHGRMRISFFRRGLTAIRRGLVNIVLSPREWMDLCVLLIPKTVLELLQRGGKKHKKLKILSTICCVAI